LARYRAGGGGAMIHRSRGRPASNRLGPGVQEYVLELVRQNFRDFGPTLAAESLLERHGVEVSRETLRKWSRNTVLRMVADGLWLSHNSGVADTLVLAEDTIWKRVTFPSDLQSAIRA